MPLSEARQDIILRLPPNTHPEIIMSKLPGVAPLWRIRFDLIEKAGGPTLPGRNFDYYRKMVLIDNR
jgi:hypothetical protein